MNILILSLKGPTPFEGGGAGEVIRQIGRRWVKKGHSVRVLTTNEKNLPRNEWIDGIEVIRKGTLYTSCFVFMKEYVSNQKKWADVVIENMTSFPLFAPIYAKPKLVIVHIIKGWDYFKLQPFWKAFIGFLSERLIPYVYQGTKFVSVSEETGRNLVKLGVQNSFVKVIPNGVDTEVFVPGTKNSHPIILYLGRLSKRKNIEDLIEAFGHVLKNFPDVQLLIVGEGEERKRLEEKATGYKNIKFLGPIYDESKKVKIYQSSWVFVLPSIKEGMPLSFLEANACGTPIISYNVPGTDYVENNENGIIVEKVDPNKLSEAIAYIIKDKKKLINLERNSRKKAKGYGWDSIVDCYMSILANGGKVK